MIYYLDMSLHPNSDKMPDNYVSLSDAERSSRQTIQVNIQAFSRILIWWAVSLSLCIATLVQGCNPAHNGVLAAIISGNIISLIFTIELFFARSDTPRYRRIYLIVAVQRFIIAIMEYVSMIVILNGNCSDTTAALALVESLFDIVGIVSLCEYSRLVNEEPAIAV